MKKIILFIFIICITLGQWSIGGAMGEKQDYKAIIKNKFNQINLLDGVSKEEAIIIAQKFMIDNGFNLKDVNFFKPQVGNSGLVDNCWAVSFDASFKVRWINGLKWFIIHINKKTGKVSSSGWHPDL